MNVLSSFFKSEIVLEIVHDIEISEDPTLFNLEDSRNVYIDCTVSLLVG